MTPREFSVNCAVCGWAVLDSTPFVYMYGAVERSRSVFMLHDHSIFDLYVYWSNFGPTSFHMNSTKHVNVSNSCMPFKRHHTNDDIFVHEIHPSRDTCKCI